MSDLLAAVLGAAVAGVIALVLQWQNLSEQRRVAARQRRSDKLEAENSKAEQESVLGFSACLKLNRIVTTLNNVRDHIQDASALAAKENMALGAALIGFSSDPDKIAFTLDELVLAKSFRNDQTLNDILDLPHVHDMYVENMRVVRELRSEISELMDSNELGPDGKSTTAFKGPNAHIAKVKMHQASILANTMASRIDEDFILAVRTFSAFQSEVQEKVGKARFGFEWDIAPVVAKLGIEGQAASGSTAAQTAPAPPGAAAL